MYDSTIFQKIYCSIDIEKHHSNHLEPYQALELISNTINKYLEIDKKIKSSELDSLLNYKKPNEYSLKVLYSLYAVNLIEELLK